MISCHFRSCEFAPILLGITLLLSSCRREGACPTCPPGESGTTSHDWTFDISRLGVNGYRGELYDVAIVNDSLAYAVGEIYLKDTAGQYDPYPYNLAKWNGHTWELQKVPYYYQGQPTYAPIYSILANGPDDFWFGIGNLIHWTQGQFIPVQVGNAFHGRILKMWGVTSGSFYIVGENGSIAEFANGAWQIVPTGTTLDVFDVFGAGGVVLAVASNAPLGTDHRIIEITGTTSVTIPDNSIPAQLMGVWIAPFQEYIVVGNGIYRKNILQVSWTSDSVDSALTLMTGVRGNSSNDLFVVGNFGEVLHFNGKNWKSYKDQTAINNGGYRAVTVKGNLMIAVGVDYPFAIAAVGRR